jgi:hypothetical protein
MAASPVDERSGPSAEDPASSIVDQLERKAEAGSPLATLLVEPGPDHKPQRPARALPAPDVVGLAVLDAHAIVSQVGLGLAVSVWETKLGPWGLILTQQPEPGAPIRSGARVHAVVAGRPHRTVPDVRGLRLEEALDSLRRDGLEPVVTARRRSSTLAAGTVVSTRPAAGALVVDGARVSLSISVGHLPGPGRDGRRPAR